MNLAGRVWTDHAYRMPCLKCELPYLLEASRPLDPELVDLIEPAFIEGQIDSQKAELAYLSLMNWQDCCANSPQELQNK